MATEREDSLSGNLVVVSIQEDDFEWHAIYSGEGGMEMVKKCEEELHVHARNLLEQGHSINWIFKTFDEKCQEVEFQAASVVILFKWRETWYFVQLGLCLLMENDKDPTYPHTPFYDGSLLRLFRTTELNNISDAIYKAPEEVWIHKGKILDWMPLTRCFGAFDLKNRGVITSVPLWDRCDDAKFVVLATHTLFKTVPIDFIQKFVKTRLDVGDHCATIAEDLAFFTRVLSYERKDATVVVVCLESRKAPKPEEPLSAGLLRYIEKRRGITLFTRMYDLKDLMRSSIFMEDNVDEVVAKFGQLKNLDFAALCPKQHVD
jgi:hypothetical protein